MLPSAHFTDRFDAGRRLGVALETHLTGDGPRIVLGLPRGGIPVAARVAEELDAPLDVFMVRKLGVPGHEELGMGAIASGGARVLNSDVIADADVYASDIAHVEVLERRELARREREYRGMLPFPSLAGRTVVVVDDGAATGASMEVALRALRALGPRYIIAAVPVASRQAVARLREVADDVVCLIAPEPFFGVGLWYGDFEQVSDAEVRLLMADARRRWSAGAREHVPSGGAT